MRIIERGSVFQAWNGVIIIGLMVFASKMLAQNVTQLLIIHMAWFNSCLLDIVIEIIPVNENTCFL